MKLSSFDNNPNSIFDLQVTLDPLGVTKNFLKLHRPTTGVATREKIEY